MGRRAMVLMVAMMGSLIGTASPFRMAPAAAAPTASPVVVSTQTLTAPDPSATGFGNGYDFDETRAVATATLGDIKVVYVFDRRPNGVWSHSATISAPNGSTSSWGAFVAVSGNTIAVADPDALAGQLNYGQVDVFDLVGRTWTRAQTVRTGGDFLTFAQGVWLTGDGMLVRDAGFCDASCYYGRWSLYQRDATNQFVKTFDSFPGRSGRLLSVGVDAGRFAVANPSFDDQYCNHVYDAGLTVRDTSTNPASVLLDEAVPYPGEPCSGASPPDQFRRVDIARGVLVTEACCANEQQLYVSRDTGNGYVPEVTLPIAGHSDALATLPDVILRLDRADRVFHTHVFITGQWTAGADIPLPADSVVPITDFLNRGVVAAGSYVGVRGDNSVHLLTVCARRDDRGGPGRQLHRPPRLSRCNQE